MSDTTPAFPAEASQLLQKAAATVNPPGDPLARQKAIERAIADIKARWPMCFREDPVDG